MMARKPVVVEGYGVKITANGGHSPGDYDNFTPVVENSALYGQADSIPIIKGPTIVRMAVGCSFSGYTFVTGLGSLSTNCDVTHADHAKCYKEGCQGSCNGVFTLSSTPFTPYACSCTWEIDDAGQSILHDGED